MDAFLQAYFGDFSSLASRIWAYVAGGVFSPLSSLFPFPSPISLFSEANPRGSFYGPVIAFPFPFSDVPCLLLFI